MASTVAGAVEASAATREATKRAPRMDPLQRASIQRVLRQLAPEASVGGMTVVVRRCLEEPMATGPTMAVIRSRLQADAYEAWARRISKWQPLLPVVTAAGLSTAEAAEYRRRATRILEDLPSAEEAARLLAAVGASSTPANGADAGAARVNGKQRASAVGRREYLQPNEADERTRAAATAPAMAVWKPPKITRTKGAAADLPTRAEPYRPTRHDQQRQLRRVKQWKLKRVLRRLDTDDAFFAIGAMDKAIKAWRTTEQVGEDALPPLQLIVEHCQTEVLLAMTTSESGHLWSVAEEGPLDAGQLLAAMESEWTAEEARELLRVGLSESKLRQLIGQATHGGATRTAVRRMVGRMRQSAHGQHAWHRGVGRTVGLVGSGMGLTGLQVASEIAGDVTWMADSCPVAHAAGGRLVRMAGHQPRMFYQAEDPALSSSAYRAGVEVITLGCAPYSNAGDGAKVEAALNEARVVMESVAARRPCAILFETSAGLWYKQRADVRRRLEGLLQNAAGYEWEAAKISPHLHCGSYSRRDRIFYMGVRRDLLRVRQPTPPPTAGGMRGLSQGREHRVPAVDGQPLDWAAVGERQLDATRVFEPHSAYSGFPGAAVHRAALLTERECTRIVELARHIGVSLSTATWRRDDAEFTLAVNKASGQEATQAASLELLECAFAVHGRACAMAQSLFGTQGVTVAAAPQWRQMPGASVHDRFVANVTEWNRCVKFNMNVIRYTTEGPDPSPHRDASPLAFVVPLQQRDVASGGGTEYAFLSSSGRREAVSPPSGTMVLHPGDAVHRGVPIVARPGVVGERWILTGFIGSSATRTPLRAEPPHSRAGDLAALSARWRVVRSSRQDGSTGIGDGGSSATTTTASTAERAASSWSANSAPVASDGSMGGAERPRGPFCARGTPHWERRCITHGGWDLREFKPWALKQLMMEDGECYAGLAGFGELASARVVDWSQPRPSLPPCEEDVEQPRSRRSGRERRPVRTFAAEQAAENAAEELRHMREAVALKGCISAEVLPEPLSCRGKRTRLSDDELSERLERKRGRDEAQREVARMRDDGQFNRRIPEAAWRRVGLLPREATGPTASS